MAKKQELLAKAMTETVREIPAACADEEKAVEFFEKQRWQGEPYCPHCGVVGACYQIINRTTGKRGPRYLWKCRDCKRQFTVKIGTVMEDSRIAYRHWAYAFWAACSSKKGVSALQIKRMTGLNYRSALFLMHRIRFAMAAPVSEQRPLTGTVEADETYMGGKPRNRHRRARRPGGLASEAAAAQDRKETVAGFLERGGEIRPVHVHKDETGQSVRGALVSHVSPDARLMTDESIIYRKIGKLFSSHETVKHSVGEYVRGHVTTNSIEGFFALLKRGVYGTFHTVSAKHLHRYLSEFQFRYNLRNVDDGERTVRAIQGAQFKRLKYADQVGR